MRVATDYNSTGIKPPYFPLDYSDRESKCWNEASNQVTTSVEQQYVYEFYPLTLKKGTRYKDYVLQDKVGVGFDIRENSVIVTLLSIGISESGEDEGDALINLFDFITDVLDEHRANPEQPLGRKFGQQMEMLRRVLRYVGPDH